MALNFLFYPYAEAVARLTNVSDTLTRLKVSITANHTVIFRITTAIQGGDDGVGGTAGDKIVIDWDVGSFTVASLSGTDITLYRGGTDDSPSLDGGRNPMATRTADDEDIFAVSTNVLTVTIGNGAAALGTTNLAANTWVKVVVGNTKITNPGTTGLKKIYIQTTENDDTVNDDAYTAVYILTDDQVVLQATVEPLLSFAIQGGASLDFGTLEPNTYHKLFGAQAAYGSIDIPTSTYGNLGAGDTVTIHTDADYIYTCKNTQADADDDSKYFYKGTTAAQAAANLMRAILNTDSAHVKANIDATTTSMVRIVAVTAGTAGNSYTLATNDATAITVNPSGALTTGKDGFNYKVPSLGYGVITGGTDMANGFVGTNLVISTNAAYGYAITIKDDDHSGSCDGFCHTNNTDKFADWSGQYGFGVYASAQNPHYGDGTAYIIATEFKSTAATPGTLQSTSAESLATYSTGPTAGDNIAIEYNVRIGADQAAGLYTDTITYIATSTY